MHDYFGHHGRGSVILFVIVVIVIILVAWWLWSRDDDKHSRSRDCSRSYSDSRSRDCSKDSRYSETYGSYDSSDDCKDKDRKH